MPREYYEVFHWASVDVLATLMAEPNALAKQEAKAKLWKEKGWELVLDEDVLKPGGRLQALRLIAGDMLGGRAAVSRASRARRALMHTTHAPGGARWPARGSLSEAGWTPAAAGHHRAGR